MTIFYVYEHWRPDKDVCFYVGKGKNGRAYAFKRRGKHYGHIVAKLAGIGMCVEVRLVASGLEEIAAFRIERERIAFWRSVGVRLANKTDGGDGSSGYKHTASTRVKMKKSDAQKDALRELHTGKTVSDATREKIRKIRTGTTLSDDTKKKLSEAFKGRQFTPEWREKISAGLMGRVTSNKTRALWSKQRRGRKSGPPSAKTRAKISAALKGHAVSTKTKEKIAAKAIARFAARQPVVKGFT